MKALNIAFKI